MAAIFTRISSMVLSIIRLIFAIYSSIVYAMRMDAALLREEYETIDYGNTFSLPP